MLAVPTQRSNTLDRARRRIAPLVEDSHRFPPLGTQSAAQSAVYGSRKGPFFFIFLNKLLRKRVENHCNAGAILLECGQLDIHSQILARRTGFRGRTQATGQRISFLALSCSDVDRSRTGAQPGTQITRDRGSIDGRFQVAGAPNRRASRGGLLWFAFRQPTRRRGWPGQECRGRRRSA